MHQMSLLLLSYRCSSAFMYMAHVVTCITCINDNELHSYGMVHDMVHDMHSTMQIEHCSTPVVQLVTNDACALHGAHKMLTTYDAEC